MLLADERGCSELLDACVAYSSHPDRFLSVRPLVFSNCDDAA